MKLDKTLSTALDLVRFIAALLVFFHHSEHLLKDKSLSIIASFGHDSVILFFLLSGFVIGYISDTKEHTLIQYTIARISRLYSVVIPALLLTYILVFFGLYFFSKDYQQFIGTDWAEVLVNSVFFLNQSWVGGGSVPTNDPYWSVCYEAWYYLIFGAAYYLSGIERVVVLLVFSIVAGVKILLLMPIWLIGFLCYKYHSNILPHRKFGYFTLFASCATYIFIRFLNFDDVLYGFTSSIFGEDYLNSRLGFSKRFVPDFVIAILFVYMFYGFYMLREDVEIPLSKFRPIITFLSSYTFSLYLFHMPLLVFLSKLSNSTSVVVIGTFIVSMVLGHYSEVRKGFISKNLTNFVGYVKLRCLY